MEMFYCLCFEGMVRHQKWYLLRDLLKILEIDVFSVVVVDCHTHSTFDCFRTELGICTGSHSEFETDLYGGFQQNFLLIVRS